MAEIKEALRGILLEIWKMEYSYEVLHHGDAGDYAGSEKIKKMMDHLIEDSTRHRRMVGDIIRMIGDEEPNLYGYKKIDFNFDRASNCEALQQIIWVEKKMLVLYENALQLISDKEHYDFLSDDGLVELRKNLDMLRRWEQAHQNLAEETLRIECR